MSPFVASGQQLDPECVKFCGGLDLDFGATLRHAHGRALLGEGARNRDPGHCCTHDDGSFPVEGAGHPNPPCAMKSA